MLEAEHRFRRPARLVRAPMSPAIVLLAGAGWGMFRIGVALVGFLADEEDLFERFVARLLDLLSPLSGLGAVAAMARGIPSPLFAVLLVYGLALFSLVAVAVCRIAAVRIARDEALSGIAALRFAWEGKWSGLLYIAILLVVLALLGLAGGVAGLVAGIPLVGPILLIPLLPLVLLASLLFTLIAFGGIAGAGLAASALATERNGTLDAVSRTYSYLFSRPLEFLFTYALALAAALVISWLGHQVFLGTAIRSLGSILEGTTLQHVLDAGFRDLRGFDRLGATEWLGAGFLWCVAWGVRLAVTGLVAGYLLSAGTSLYFHLRREVDGVPEDDIDLGLRDDRPEEPPEAPGAPREASPPQAEGSGSSGIPGAPPPPAPEEEPRPGDDPGPGASENCTR